MGVIKLIGILFRALLANRAALAMENLALRQQLAVLERSVKRPALRQRDRIFWALTMKSCCERTSCRLLDAPCRARLRLYRFSCPSSNGITCFFGHTYGSITGLARAVKRSFSP